MNLLPGSSRREFIQRLAQFGITCTVVSPPWGARAAGNASGPPNAVLTFPAQWQFQLPKGAIILVSDQQLDDLTDPDKEIDLSLSSTPNRTSLRRLCEQERARGARVLILAFDEFWTQYRPGQGGQPRRLLPDMDEYIDRLRRISETLRTHGLGLELSLLSPLEVGVGYTRATGESGSWVQYREGWRDPANGHFTVQLWEHLRWTNNKGTIELKRAGVRAFAFREQRVGRTAFYRVDPGDIVELKAPLMLEPAATPERGGTLRRLTIRGEGETGIGPLDRVLVVVSYLTPELDYFSPKALPFLKDLVERYHRAEIPLRGLYADEMHIQQDWRYFDHHDEGQFTLRYLTENMRRRFAAQYGPEFGDFDRYLVYFAYGQHGFLTGLEARWPAQHVLGAGADEIQHTFLLRRRYYDLLDRTVIGLFAEAKRHAETLYGGELEARAHATWAQSPTIDSWRTGNQPLPPRQYEYTADFEWSNTVHQAASACGDYFRWNEFLTGGGNDHAEGGWADRNYYGLALACSTGVLNRWPNAYAAAWGMPGPALTRHQVLQDAYGAAATPAFQAIEDCVHRDIEVLMLYPLSLVACEERFGSWMVQYGYANYITPDKLLEHGRLRGGGWLEVAGRRFNTVAALFEPLPPAGLVPFLAEFANAGGRVIWTGPVPRLDLAGAPVLEAWQALFGVARLEYGQEGFVAAGETVEFGGSLKHLPAQAILTDFLVDRIYPVKPVSGVEPVARVGDRVVGVRRGCEGGGTATFLGFRPRDDQAASLGREVRTWFELLKELGAYPPSRADLATNDNPAVVSRESPFLATRFPNGATVVAAHYRSHVETWGGGFHRDDQRDAEIIKANPLPPADLVLDSFPVNGYTVDYRGKLIVAFRLDAGGRLVAFGGHRADRIRIDGRDYVFSDAPLDFIAWAPVLESRRVPGGAQFELWVQGSAGVSIPLPESIVAGRLCFQGPCVGQVGDEVNGVTCQDGWLRFRADPAWGQAHLYLL